MSKVDSGVTAQIEVTLGGDFWLDKGKAKIATRKGSEIVLADVAKKFGMTVGIRTRGMLNRLTEQYAHTIRNSIIRVLVEQRAKNWPDYSKGYAERKLKAPRNNYGLTMLMFTGHLSRNIKVKSAGLMDGNINAYRVFITGQASSPLPRKGDDKPVAGRVWRDRGTTFSNRDLVIRQAKYGRDFMTQGVDEGKREFQAYLRSKDLTGLFYGKAMDTEWVTPTESGGGDE